MLTRSLTLSSVSRTASSNCRLDGSAKASNVKLAVATPLIYRLVYITANLFTGSERDTRGVVLVAVGTPLRTTSPVSDRVISSQFVTELFELSDEPLRQSLRSLCSRDEE